MACLRNIDEPVSVICLIADEFLDRASLDGHCHTFLGKRSADRQMLPCFRALGNYDFTGEVKTQRLEISVPSALSQWRKFPPIVRVHADWLSPFYAEQDQSLANWHRYPDNELCWIKPQSWQKQCEQIENNEDVRRVVRQMFKDVDYLLSCHMVAYCHRLKEWDKSWSAEEHGY